MRSGRDLVGALLLAFVLELDLAVIDGSQRKTSATRGRLRSPARARPRHCSQHSPSTEIGSAGSRRAPVDPLILAREERDLLDELGEERWDADGGRRPAPQPRLLPGDLRALVDLNG